MNRFTVLQNIINIIKAQVYLEIGVFNGDIISNITCNEKIGVDPEFKFNWKKKVKKILPSSKFRTFEVTSDTFFENYAPNILTKGIDVAFVDGLHTYDQALRDVENCLKYLNKDGFIVMHDCNPNSRANEFPVKNSINEALELAKKGKIPGWNNCWNGDVWKALVHLRITHPELNIFTLDLDWGLGIITYGVPDSQPSISIQELKNSDYSLLESERSELLNLKNPTYLKTYLRKSSVEF